MPLFLGCAHQDTHTSPNSDHFSTYMVCLAAGQTNGPSRVHAVCTSVNLTHVQTASVSHGIIIFIILFTAVGAKMAIK